MAENILETNKAVEREPKKYDGEGNYIILKDLTDEEYNLLSKDAQETGRSQQRAWGMIISGRTHIGRQQMQKVTPSTDTI